ncbi:MAG: NAD+ synthase [Ignavibacteriae bacterium]|nr:NAD+ synthase [Ignavibacteriota bacterium]
METVNKHNLGLELDTSLVRKLLVDFIKDEIHNAGFTKGVVGLSGGVDSAVVMTLATEALGKENVRAVLMPYRTSSKASVDDAQTLVHQLAIPSEIVEITPMVEAYLQKYPESDNVRKGNLMARQRMIVLYDISARENALVIGTSNKTETLLGYGTLFGDTACAINPIGDLYKTQIWQLAKAIGVPQQIIDKKPSADLWEGQTDEGELGFSYKQVDELLYHLVDERRSDEELLELGFEKYFIEKVKRLIQRNEFKRRPPVVAKISNRTINVDFRYARDWGI